jgi:6,7-dimethyl-8-ribityllumazine synthase
MTQKKNIAFIKAQWHADIVDQSLIGFREQHGEAYSQIDVYDVPGAFEMPLLAKRLASSGRYSAVVCAAFVVDGGIYRHDFVSQAVVDGLMRVQLDTDVPVFSVSLTPHNFQDTNDYKAFFKKHFLKKGQEAAEAVHMMVSLGHIGRH